MSTLEVLDLGKLERNDFSLYNSVQRSIGFIEKTFAQYPYVISDFFYSFYSIGIGFNGGKDSVVLLALIQHVLLTLSPGKFHDEFISKTQVTPTLRDLRTIFFSNPDNFVEVAELMWKIADSNNLNVTVINDGFMDGLKKLVDPKRDNNINEPPLLAIFMGTRFADTDDVNLSEFSVTDSNWPHIIRVNPILSWDYNEIWRFIHFFNIPYCSLYERGYTSLGSILDTEPNKELWVEENKCFLPAWFLKNGSLERIGRKKESQ